MALLRDLPRVIIKTIDLSEVLVPAVGRVFCVIGPSSKGPVNKPTFINSAADLIRIFGVPETDAGLNAYLILTQGGAPVLFNRTFHPDLINKVSDEDGEYYVPVSQLIPIVDTYEAKALTSGISTSDSLTAFMKEYLNTHSDIKAQEFLNWLVSNTKWTDAVAGSLSLPNCSWGDVKVYGFSLKQNRNSFNYIGKLLNNFGGILLLDLTKAFEKENIPIGAGEILSWASGNSERKLVVWKIPGVYLAFFDVGNLVDELGFYNGVVDNLYWQDSNDIRYTDKFSYRSQYYRLMGTLPRIIDPLETFKIFAFDVEVYVSLLLEKNVVSNNTYYALSIGVVALGEVPSDVDVEFTSDLKKGDKFLLMEGNFYIDSRTEEEGGGEPIYHYDVEWLRSLTSYFPGRTSAWVVGNYKPSNSNWTASSYLQQFFGANSEANYPRLPNLLECLSTMIVDKKSPIWNNYLLKDNVTNPKNFLVILRDNQYTDLMKSLWKDEYSRDTLYWGGGFQLKSNFSLADEIWKFYEGRTADDKASDICLVGAFEEILEGDLSNPNFTDYWFLLVPTKSRNSSLYGKVLALLEKRDQDFIYLPVIEKDYATDNYSEITESCSRLAESPWIAYYWPGVKIVHPFTGKEIPISASLVAAIKFAQLPIYWESPAGKRKGAIEFSEKVNRRLSEGQADILFTDAHVNPILRPSRGSPLCIWGGRTSYKKGSRVKSALSWVNVSSLVVYIKKNLREVLTNFVFEINNPMLFNRFLQLFDPFMQEIKRAGGIYDYTLTNATTPEDIDRGEMKIYVAIQPAREVERIYGYIVITRTGAKFTLA